MNGALIYNVYYNAFVVHFHFEAGLRFYPEINNLFCLSAQPANCSSFLCKPLPYNVVVPFH